METKTCTKCGEIKSLDEFHNNRSSKNGKRPRCKVCHCLDNKQWAKENPEKVTLKMKRYRQAIKEKPEEERAIYRAKAYARKKKYRQTHKTKHKLSANHTEYMRSYSKTPKGKAAHMRGMNKRRALKSNVWCEVFNPQEVFVRDGYVCQHCGKKTRPDYKSIYHNLYPNLDHIIPLSKGGEHSKRNTQCLCRKCNLSKQSNDTGEQLRMFG